MRFQTLAPLRPRFIAQIVRIDVLNIDGMRELLAELIAAGFGGPSDSRGNTQPLAALMASYVIGLRDLRYERSKIDEAVRMVVGFTLD